MLLGFIRNYHCNQHMNYQILELSQTDSRSCGVLRSGSFNTEFSLFLFGNRNRSNSSFFFVRYPSCCQSDTYPGYRISAISSCYKILLYVQGCVKKKKKKINENTHRKQPGMLDPTKSHLRY